MLPFFFTCTPYSVCLNRVPQEAGCLEEFGYVDVDVPSEGFIYAGCLQKGKPPARIGAASNVWSIIRGVAICSFLTARDAQSHAHYWSIVTRFGCMGTLRERRHRPSIGFAISLDATPAGGVNLQVRNTGGSDRPWPPLDAAASRSILTSRRVAHVTH